MIGKYICGIIDDDGSKFEQIDDDTFTTTVVMEI